MQHQPSGSTWWVAQSVERLVVVQKVAGSSPVTHPVEIGMNFKKVHADLFFPSARRLIPRTLQD